MAAVSEVESPRLISPYWQNDLAHSCHGPILVNQMHLHRYRRFVLVATASVVKGCYLDGYR